ncbi:hypothetical protein COOONC_21457 [Cooperia oncophora]
MELNLNPFNCISIELIDRKASFEPNRVNDRNATLMGEQLRSKLLQRYFGPHGRLDQLADFPDGAVGHADKDYELRMEERSLYDIQCRLNDAGASDLVIDIITEEPSREIFLKAIHLAKALLLEGNDKVCLPSLIL